MAWKCSLWRIHMPTELPLLRHFDTLVDPRRTRRRKHPLGTVLGIAICAVIAGATDFQEIAVFGEKRRDWLARFLDLTNGVPSHDTFERVFARLEPRAFQRCFAAWMTVWHKTLTGKHLAIDGKVFRGTARPTAGLRALTVVNVWATEARLCLGMVACEADSNEIPAIPVLLDLLDLKGALVTIDAAGCQTAIATKIVAAGGDYVITVKENQPGLFEAVEAAIEGLTIEEFTGPTVSTHTTTESKHGRKEVRTYVVMSAPEEMAGKADWAGLKTIGACYSERTVGRTGKTTYETRYFIGSKKASAAYYGAVVRGHWRVENNLHWQLDVTFGEDANRKVERTAAINLGLVRRLALNLLTHEPTQMSKAKKQFAAALDTDFLDKILQTGVNLEKV